MTATSFGQHRLYAQLRVQDPIHWHAPSGAWLITRHADVSALLLDDRLSSRTTGDLLGAASSRQRRAAEPLIEFFDSWLVLSDGTMHSTLRKAVMPAMSSARTADWADAFDGVARSALTREAPDGLGSPSAIRRYARGFAGAAICAMLGIRDDERGPVRAWAGELLRFMAEPSLAAARVERAAEALRRLRRYALDVGRTRTRWLGLPTLLAGAGDLPDGAFAALFAQLIAGGSDPVARTLESAVDAVVALGLPIGDATERACVTEEALRFDAPFHVVPRIARSALQVGGRRIRQDERVLLVLASANRDEAVFDAPDRFLLERDRSGPHLSFGRGRHRCLGPIIARLELDRALAALDGATVARAVRLGGCAQPRLERVVRVGRAGRVGRVEPPGLI